jgi:hypothetical protein
LVILQESSRHPEFLGAKNNTRATRAQGGGIPQDLHKIHLQHRPQIQTMLPVGVLGDGLVAEVTIGDSLGP